MCVKDNKRHFVKVHLSVPENVGAIMAGNPNKQGEINSNEDGYNNGFCKRDWKHRQENPGVKRSK